MAFMCGANFTDYNGNGTMRSSIQHINKQWEKQLP